jgi:hypothetical protein
MRILNLPTFLLLSSIPLFAAGCGSRDKTPSSQATPTSTTIPARNNVERTVSKDGREIRASRTDSSGHKFEVIIRQLPSPTVPAPQISPKLPDCPREETILEAEKAVEILWEAFPSIPWDEKSPGNCEEFQETGNRWKITDEWCVRCPSCKGTYLEERYYHALSPDAEACVLEEVHFSLFRKSVRRLSEAENLLTARMEKDFGPNVTQEEQPPSMHPFTNYLKWWHTKDNSVYLNTFQDEDRLIVRVRHHHLEKTLSEKKDFVLPLLPPIYTRQEASDPVDLELGQALKERYPNLPELLTYRFDRYSSGIVTPHPDKVLQVLLQLLESWKEAPVDLQPAILLACDRLTGLLSSRFKVSSKTWPSFRTKLEAYGLRFAPNHRGDCWEYDHSLLRTTLKEYPRSLWAEKTFLSLMQNGFQILYPRGGCTDSFYRVIKEGEAFLRQNPSPPYRLEALFLLAQAYETWWSLSKASEKDEYIHRSEYAEGADNARIMAVQAYAQVRELAPDSRYAKIAGWKLPRLRLGFDTNQRRFSSCLDD